MKLVTVLFFIFSVLGSSISEDEKMAWDENYKLSWSDFKAVPKGNGFVASTSSGISFSYKFSFTETGEILDLDVSILCYFYPENSWFIPSETSVYILKHEQAHFDISELHARILRKKISETTFSKDLKNEIEAIYKGVEEERQTMQHLFDAESDHSKIKEKELEWEAFVAQQLETYERWK